MVQLTNSDIIATASVLVAVLAMFATFWQAHIARKHNKLAVRPILDHQQEWLLGKDTRLKIMNHGLGPGIIHEVRFVNLHLRLSCNELLEYIQKQVEDINLDFQCANFVDDTMIAPTQSIELFCISPETNDLKTCQRIWAILSQFKLTITYSSIYDVKYNYNISLRLA